MFRVNGQPAIGLAIAMRDGGDILALGHNIDAKRWREITANLPIGIEPMLVADQPVTVEHAIDEFMESLWEAIAIMLACSFVSLGLRAGAVVALSIPLVLAIVFPIMEFIGIDLQRISLGALIIALGLLVDDAMTTVEAMITRLAARRRQGARRDLRLHLDWPFPMLTGTLVTVAGFVPIGFARSCGGRVHLLDLRRGRHRADRILVRRGAVLAAARRLDPQEAQGRARRGARPDHARLPRASSSWRMRARWLTIARHARPVRGVARVAMRFVPQQFFPASDRPELLVDLQLPQNASIYASETRRPRLDALLKGDPDVDHWSTYVGRGAVRFYLPLNVQLPNDFFAQAVIVDKDLDARERVQARLEKVLASEFPSVVGRVYPLELGPPVGWPLQYRVSGPEPDQVRDDRASSVAQVIGADPDARQRQLRLDRAGAHGAHPRRPGRGAPARPELAGISPQSLNAVDDRRHRDPGARRHLSGRRGRPRPAEQRMSLDDAAHPAGAAAERPDGAAEPDSRPSSTARSIRWSGGATGVPTLTVQADVVPGV